MEKAGHATFSKIKTTEYIDVLGKSVHITNRHFKMLLEDALTENPKELQNYYH